MLLPPAFKLSIFTAGPFSHSTEDRCRAWRCGTVTALLTRPDDVRSETSVWVEMEGAPSDCFLSD